MKITNELRMLCKWCKDHDAFITEIKPFGFLATDGSTGRRYEPEGGLTIERWPYLKICCGPKGDEDCIQACRDEIAEAILKNEIQKKGHSLGVARGVVDELHRACNEGNWENFWAVMELPLDDVMHLLDELTNEFGE